MVTAEDQSPSDASRMQTAFVDLICQDEEWVRAEFDAIVAAMSSSTPPRAAVLGSAQGPRHAPAFRANACAHAEGGTDHRPRVREWRRQRSPP